MMVKLGIPLDGRSPDKPISFMENSSKSYFGKIKSISQCAENHVAVEQVHRVVETVHNNSTETRIIVQQISLI